MGINNKLTYLNDTKTAIKKAIIDKGVDVLDTDTFRSYAEKIGQIEGGGSGGSGGEVIEAIVDESALPIEAGKKVVVANIQATGQGAGALMPFDIVPYNANGSSVRNLLQLHDEYPLHVNTIHSSGPAHIGYKKVGDKWQGKYFANIFTGINKPNDSFNLLYDVNTYRYFSGSSGKYWNPIKNQEETITFDEPLSASLIANVTTRYFLTYDSKYLWAVHLNVANSNQSAANKGLICLYEITIDDTTGEVFARKKTEEIEITKQTGNMQSCVCSLNHYGVIVYTVGNASNMTYVQYNEVENTLTAQTGSGLWAGYSSFDLAAFTKDWVLLRYSSYCRVYWGDIFTGGLQGWNFGTAIYGYELARFGNTFYPLANYYDGVGSTSMTFMKMPVDKEQPTSDDFTFNTVTCYSTDAGPYMIDEDNCIMGSNYQYDCTQSLRCYNIPNNKRTESDPSKVPVMLFDDGTGYFYENNTDIYNYAKVSLIAPVEGSYNNGAVLKTIDPSTPFHKIINTASTGSGQGFRFGALPMRYINNGDSFVFHNYPSGSNTASGVSFFKSSDEDPQIIPSLGEYRGVRVTQNKVYLTSYNYNSNNKSTSMIVCDEKGMNTYEVTSDNYNLQGMYFEFEGNTYVYPLLNRDAYTGKQNNGYYRLSFDSETMVCTAEVLGNTELDYLNQLGQYVTGTDMAKSNPYPDTGYKSLYSTPVITKDNKYFVGLAGNHTTHYGKLEKSPSGLPMLNVYEFPQKLKDLLYEQQILYFEAYYPSGFGIQLANGTFLLCEYEQGIDVDLNITTYTPSHSYTPDSYNQCLMHFTSHKHYWYFSAGTYYSSGSKGGYAGCGRREDLPSTYQTKVYSMKHSFAGADHVTGYLTGESYKDDNGKLIAEVEVLRK